MRAKARNTRVAIIGAGWAGLAAAVELCCAGLRPVVFEAAPQSGGRARRVDIQGHPLDNGQHILIGAYREILRLMQGVGADPERLFHRFPLELEHARAGFRFALPKFWKPLNLAIGLMKTEGAPLGEKIAAARFIQTLKRNDFRLAEEGAARVLYDRHALRGQMRRYFWDPLCLSALNTPPERASAQLLANVLRDSFNGARADTDFLLPATDLSALFPDAAEKFIVSKGGALRLKSRVESFRPSAAGILIGEEGFDHVILAAAPRHALSLLEHHAETQATARMLSAYAHEPMGTVYAAYPPEITLPAFMRGMMRAAPEAIGQWAFDRGRLDKRNGGILSFVLSSDANGWMSHDNETLAARLHQELESVLDRALPQPAWTRVLRERRATISCRPNLPRPAVETALRGLWLAGDYVYADYPATLEGAVRSGVIAARRILKTLQ